MSRTYNPRDEDIAELVVGEAARRIAGGELLVIPTDTVYGIAADAFSPAAVQALLDAKGRDRAMPPPVLIPNRETLDGLADDVPAFVRELAAQFWPGALTIICKSQPFLDWDLGETHGTVALRMPDDPATLALLRKTGPLAVSSANTSGSPAALTIEDAQAMLGESVSMYLDGGRVTGGAASTIIDATINPPRIVRAGAIAADRLRSVVPQLLDDETPEE